MCLTAPPLRILLVDDNMTFRRELRDFVREQPELQVVGEASDAAEALRQVSRLRPDGLDVVLMDINLPGTDGIQATEEITRNDPNLPVIMLTVSTLDRDLFEAVRVGAVGYLSKALPADAIAHALRDFHEHEALPMSAVMATRVLRYFQSRSA